MNTSDVVTIRLDPKSRRRLERLAGATERSKSYLAAEAIRAYLDLNEWQVREIASGLKEADAGDFATEAKVKSVVARLKRRAG